MFLDFIKRELATEQVKTSYAGWFYNQLGNPSLQIYLKDDLVYALVIFQINISTNGNTTTINLLSGNSNQLMFRSLNLFAADIIQDYHYLFIGRKATINCNQNISFGFNVLAIYK